MAVLSDTERLRVWRGLMRYWSALREALGALTKADLRAAVDAADGWLDTNAASFNSAIPQPARGQLTTAQKALLLAVVALARHDPARLRDILGEVD
jgi:hypothetical protein